MIEHMFDRVNLNQAPVYARIVRHDDRVSPRSGAGPRSSGPVQLRPLTARSAILSLLLGSHPPAAEGSQLVAFGGQVGIKESAVRAALTRMVAAGDLHRSDGSYRLSDRLLERQRRQDEAMEVPIGAWDRTWCVAAVVSTGKDAASRLNLRRSMLAAHFGELREGVWMRPDNLGWRPEAHIEADLEILRAHTGTDDRALAARLFDPDSWARRGRLLVDTAGAATTLRDRLTAFAAIVRHLTHDPLLPDELLPRDWPGGALRSAYDDFRDELLAGRPEQAAR
jgi:phenylacetic acid degradation operon negative regulatory protein